MSNYFRDNKQTAFDARNYESFPQSFLFYDFETQGLDARRDGITQLAAKRVNASTFEAIGDDFCYKVKPQDYEIVSLGASLVTGHTTPDLAGDLHAISEGYLAYSFYNYINQTQNTCVVGFNNLSFDDTVLEHLFFRNFLPIYTWRFQNRNSRFDMLVGAVAMHTLCPHVIPEWPINEETGKYDYRLVAFSEKLGIVHTHAHDAMSDVDATASLMEIMLTGSQRRPLTPEERSIVRDFNLDTNQVFKYVLEFRDKNAVSKFINKTQNEVIVWFNPRMHRETRSAVPVLVLNHYTADNENQTIYLIDLLYDSEKLEGFFKLVDNEEDFKAYFELNSRNRKFGCPVFKTQFNKCPVFARVEHCVLNTELHSPEVKEVIKKNTILVQQNSAKLHQLVTLIKKYQYASTRNEVNEQGLAPDFAYVGFDTTPNYTPEQMEKLEKFKSSLIVSNEMKNSICSSNARPYYFPEGELTSNLSLIFADQIKELWSARNNDIIRHLMQSYRSRIQDVSLNNLILMYLGNNEPDVLANANSSFYVEYLRICLERLEYSWECFQNELAEERRKYLLGEYPSPADEKINLVKSIAEQTTDYYKDKKEELLSRLSCISDYDYKRVKLTRKNTLLELAKYLGMDEQEAKEFVELEK